MEFEFDPAKSQANFSKHGIDFLEAQLLWEDEERLEIPARSDGEPRFVLLGHYRNRVWAAIFTYRRERVRLISVRRAREIEERHYHDQV